MWILLVLMNILVGIIIKKIFKKIFLKIPYNKPIIITEFGGGAKYGYHGNENQRWTEEFQKNVYINSL